MHTICCIGTGPSLTLAQIEAARRKCGALFVCNDAFRWVPDADLLFACNWQWWDRRWPEVRSLSAEKWTTRLESASKYGINYITEKWGLGLSTEYNVLHHGHGSGYQLVGMAYRAGATRIVLLGYDMKYAPDYDGKAKQIGSGLRHFFGEYEPELQHWPSIKVVGGVHVELCELYRTIARQGLVEIINCTPDSALDAFPKVSINAL